MTAQWRFGVLRNSDWALTPAKGQSRRFGDVRVTSAFHLIADVRQRGRQVRKVPKNETARAVGRCGMAVPAIDGTMRASYLMMMRGQKQIVQHDDLAISSTALGAHRTWRADIRIADRFEYPNRCDWRCSHDREWCIRRA